MKCKQWIALLLALALAAALLGCAPAEEDEVFSMDAVRKEINSRSVSDFSPSEEATNYVMLTIRGHGSLVLRLRPDVAPISAENFKTLVGKGFYDGLTFHRVYPGFMIQGGDPTGTGGGDASQNIKGEFADNGVPNNLLHLRGVLSMARANDPDSASCQFFIMQEDSSSLNGKYAAFGYVVAGLETVDSVCTVDLAYNAGGELSSPVEPVILESAVFVTPND